MRAHVVLAVFKRNFWSYFSGVIGYLFIVAFVFLGALLAFPERFFANNVASLDQLNEWFPQLLLFIVPAITMSIWSEERKLGTEELLFTLPVSDLEVLIGKYLAVVSVYTVALAFSLTNVVSLSLIGNPDPGLILTTYVGYWLAGCALLAAGMVASQLTNSSTVAFVLGSAICAIPVYAGRLSFISSWLIPFVQKKGDSAGTAKRVEELQSIFTNLSLGAQFKPFGMGLIPSQGLFYFLAFIGLMLYINYVLIGYRHWSGGVKGTNMGLQYAVRAASLLLILIGVGVILSPFGFRSDFTSERLYSLSPATQNVLKELKSDRAVTVQAFVSRVPTRDYVAVKGTLLGLLGQYRQSTSNLMVRIVEVDPSSEEAAEAKDYGIETRDDQFEVEGATRLEKVVMGAVINCGTNEIVIPHFGKGTPIEYELTRSIQVASNETRKTIGILETDAKITGGFDMQSMRANPEWRIVTELKKSYNVETVPATMPITGDKYDVLLAVMPSSLGQNEMMTLVNYVRSGKPVLIIDDPIPAMNPGLSPHLPKPRAGGNPMMGMQMPPEPKADGGKATSLTNLLGIEWIYDQVIWDDTSLEIHPEYERLLREEIVSITSKSGNAKAFNADSPVTKNLQEVMLFFSGSIREREIAGDQKPKIEFQPLLTTGTHSGILKWDDLVKSGMFGGISIDPSPLRVADKFAHIAAGRITSVKGADDKIDVIYVADSDLISDFFFDLRERKSFKLDLDNVTFILNAFDLLANDTATIELRSRRPKHRTLTSVEQQTAKYIEEEKEERKNAADESKKALEDAEKTLSERVQKIRKDDTLDEETKRELLLIAEAEQTRRLDVEKANIEQKKEARIDAAKAKSDRSVRQVKDKYYTLALLVSPIPALFLGLIVLMVRLSNEQRDISPTRRARAA